MNVRGGAVYIYEVYVWILSRKPHNIVCPLSLCLSFLYGVYIFFTSSVLVANPSHSRHTRLWPVRPACHPPNREEEKKRQRSTFRRFLLRKRKSICRCCCRVCRAGRGLSKLCPAMSEAFVGCDALLAKEPRMVVTERENPSDGKRFEVRRKRHGVFAALVRM